MKNKLGSAVYLGNGDLSGYQTSRYTQIGHAALIGSSPRPLRCVLAAMLSNETIYHVFSTDEFNDEATANNFQRARKRLAVSAMTLIFQRSFANPQNLVF